MARGDKTFLHINAIPLIYMYAVFVEEILIAELLKWPLQVQ